MRGLKLYITILITAFVVAFSGNEAKAQCGPFNSIMNQNNGQNGNMFMITALNAIRIDSFWCNFSPGTIPEVEIWYREGSFVGFQNSPVGWTKVDSVTNLPSQGINNFTKVPIFVDVEIQAGCSVSFYVTGISAPIMRYTNGPAGSTAGQNYSTGTDLILSYAYGKQYPFAATFNPRIWNGRIHYSCIPPSIPSATYTNIPTASCSGDTLCYSFIPGSTLAPGAWSWNPGQSGTIVSANNDSSTVCMLFDGTVVFDTVCLTLEGGCDDVDTCFPITINPPTADAGPDTSICATTYQLQGNTAQGFWSVMGGAGTFADPTVYNTTVSGLAPGVNTLRWSVANSTCDTVFDEVNITVLPIPVAQFNAPYGCDDNAIAFLDNSYALGGNIISWAWDVDGDGSTDYTTSAFNHTYTAPGIYNCTLTVMANGGCVDELIQPIVVAPNPQVNFSYTPECEGNAMLFADMTTIASGNLDTWEWQWDDGTSPSGAQNPAHVYLTDGWYIVTLTVTSDSGCVTSYADSVEVFSIPFVDFESPEVCQNDTVFFTDTSVSTQGIINYWEWDFGDGFPIDYNQHTAHMYGTHGLYNVRLTVATDKGCTNTVVKPQRSFPVPVPNYLQEGVCERQRVTFTEDTYLDTIFGSMLTTFHWDFGDSTDAINGEVGHFYQDPGYYQLGLTPYTNYGCHTTGTFEILIRPKPEAKILILDDKVCAFNEINYRDETYFDYEFDSVGVVSWQWHFGDGSTSSKTHPKHTFERGGDFNTQLIVQTGFGCYDTAARTTVVYHIPDADFVIDSIEGCSPHCVTFIDNSRLASGEDLKNHWNFGDGGINTQDINPTYCYSVPDGSGLNRFPVELSVMSPFGCVDTFMHPEKVSIHGNPIADFELSANIVEFLEPVVFVDNYSVGADFWLWNFGDSTISTLASPNKHEYQAPGDYVISLTVSDDYGCQDVISKTLTVERHQTLFFPSTFTPNGDGLNDYFEVEAQDLEYIKLWVFDRWGDELFYGENDGARWDGKINGYNLPLGVYSFVVEYKQVNQIKQKKRGKITIARNDR